MKLCYFGIYRSTAPRDKSVLSGLRKQNVEIVECVDSSRGFRKFFALTKKHHALKGDYDILFVGYLSPILVPLARILSRKPVVFNALCSNYESYVLDRALHRPGSFRAMFIWFVDFLAFHLAKVTLVESEEQKKFIAKMFRVRPDKLEVILTGADEEVFFPDPAVPKAESFTVLFRGMFLPATGVEYCLEAARLLKDEDIEFIVIGWGELRGAVEKTIKENNLSRVKLIHWFLEPDVLRKTMLGSHIALGQFSKHSRLDRTIQHKTFEALALGLPFITRDSKSNRELLTGGEDCIFVPRADAPAIVEAIRRLKADDALREKLSRGARKSYVERASSVALANKLLPILDRLLQ